MKEKTIKLKQQTPMWHFQPEMPGCCLRATEVKPKLDRFLLAKVGKQDARIHLVNGTQGALDYKLFFMPNGDPSFLNAEKYPLFFGNIGEQQKKLVFYEDEIDMNVFSLHQDLLGLIKEHLCEFFATHSFGTRQDKGFGFFFPEGQGGSVDTPYGAKYQFEINLDAHSKLDFEKIFKYIHYFHKLIRSGINENGCYYKSLMYFYARSKGEQWDKPTIRHHFQFYTPVYKSICGEMEYSYSVTMKNGKVKTYGKRKDMVKEYAQCVANKEQCKLFRDALGLASQQQWLAYKDAVTIKCPDITRFKSPITYRPVMNGAKCIVYIYFDDATLKDLKTKQFTISHRREDGISPLTGMRVFEGFSFADYFDSIARRYEVCRRERQSINEQRGGKKNECIECIFDPLRKNFKKIESPVK